MMKATFEGLKQIAQQCFEMAKEKGWWDRFAGRNMTPDEIAAKLCLIHSEVSEALEEVRNGAKPPQWGARYLAGLSTFTELAQAKEFVAKNGYPDFPKPEGFASELADVVIRVFDLSTFLGIDIAEAIREKMEYNKSREYRHGGKAL